MIKIIKREIYALTKYIYFWFYNHGFCSYANKSYSQEGEDQILRRIFNGKKDGFYVDVGAFHPKRFSNTFALYKLGWQGINIEPNPEILPLFKKNRPRDLNLCLGIGLNREKINYFMLNDAALNTFDKKVLNNHISKKVYKYIKTISIEIKPLAEVLIENIPKNKRIDFFSIDTEGFDLNVLKSNDWNAFRPDWVLVEKLNLNSIENLNFEIHHYMKSLRYVLFAKTFNTLFYKSEI